MGGFIQVPADSVGKKVDTVTLSDAGSEVHRQKMVVTGGSGTAEVVVVTNAAPGANDMGLVVRQAGTADVALAGKMALSGTSIVAGIVTLGATADVALAGKVAISGTALVAGVVSLGAGVANIGFINNISATVLVAGVVSLGAGVANIGFINNISATVVTGLSYVIEKTTNSQVQVGDSANAAIRVNVVAGSGGGPTQVSLAAGVSNIGFLDSISRTVQVAIATPFTVNNISATSIVAGTLSIGGQVSVAGTVSMFTGASIISASRGPRCFFASTSANASFVAAPGAGMAIYVTAVGCSNGSGTTTRARVGSSATVGNITMLMAASGGGFVMQFVPPWKLSTNEALVGSVKPNASDGIFNIHFYVASADAA